ncbi:Cbf1p NDAI_0A04030 [Naumovozyma dairenensis CBS 421]|uniref:BHLH domain-containing protein n=1 Tax=Naumovozyma dairenensis (strain ATCC 10597 / BCRC 20456 / CBS 421 / NBRC 0211 / NRRL Y-12639) TaxID=1071378 RepID=G0W422_NAUDC|nr:hypothetical protein NDAI_0A04030 [Naumovozyma dairenensis CBS 421]CCD22560.1 hypothetical protein NDAI_0A04030 [Naumovozyma dairenensis CBS 421]
MLPDEGKPVLKKQRIDTELNVTLTDEGNIDSALLNEDTVSGIGGLSSSSRTETAHHHYEQQSDESAGANNDNDGNSEEVTAAEAEAAAAAVANATYSELIHHQDNDELEGTADGTNDDNNASNDENTVMDHADKDNEVQANDLDLEPDLIARRHSEEIRNIQEDIEKHQNETNAALRQLTGTDNNNKIPGLNDDHTDEGDDREEGNNNRSSADDRPNSEQTRILGRRGRKPLGTSAEERRESHKEVEKRRRKNINDAINVLSELLPVTESNKAAILTRAAEYIGKLKETEKANIEKWTLQKLLAEQQASQLATANEKLQAELKKAYKQIESLERKLRHLNEKTEVGIELSDNMEV